LIENAISARDPGGNCWNSSKQKSEGLQSLLELLTGKQIKGNHYSDYDEPKEGCNDADYVVGFCDQPRMIEGGAYLSPAISGRN
jgi:hypothetical protein